MALRTSRRLIVLFLSPMLALIGFLLGVEAAAQAAALCPEHTTAALTAAMKQANGTYVLPPGVSKITGLDIPAGLTVVGAKSGKKTVLVAVSKGTNPLVTLGSGAHLSDVEIEGEGTNRHGIEIKDASDVVVRNVEVENFGQFGIEADHARNLTIRDCAISKCQRGINLEYCHDAAVTDNWVKDVAVHAIEFWGNWDWKAKDSSNLSFSHNWVSNGSGGGIWGSGASNVLMTENEADNFGDVGLDLEWCDKGTITHNRVSNCRNAGISLFYSCMNVSITANRIVEVVPEPDHQPDSGRWQGIWLTTTNPKVFPNDFGHAHVLIAQNRILQVGATLPALGIPAEASDIVQEANVVIARPGRN